MEDVARDSEERIMDSLRTVDETLQYLNNFAMQISEDPSRLVR